MQGAIFRVEAGRLATTDGNSSTSVCPPKSKPTVEIPYLNQSNHFNQLNQWSKSMVGYISFFTATAKSDIVASKASAYLPSFSNGM